MSLREPTEPGEFQVYGVWLSGKCRRGRGKKYKGARAKKYKGARAAHVSLWGARRSRPSSSESADGDSPWRGSAAGTHRSDQWRKPLTQ